MAAKKKSKSNKPALQSKSPPKSKAKAPAKKAPAKPAPKAAKPAPKAAAKAPTKPAPKAATKPAPKAAAKAPTKPAPKAATKPAPKAATKPAPKAATKPAPKAAAKAPTKPAPKAATKPAPKAAKASGTSQLVKSVKQAAAKVAQVAAAAAVKILDSDAGRKAADFDLLDEKGEQVTSSSLAGKPYLLYFYPKDDTPGCTKEACDIRDNFGRFGQQGLRVLGVSPDSTKSHAKFGKKYGLPFTLLSDPDKVLANAYGVWGTKQNYGKEYLGIIRSSFLIGADGLVKKAYRGVKVDGHIDAVLEDAKAFL